LGNDRRIAIVEQLDHEALPCPARRLELVVYTCAAVSSPSWPLPFELNFNTGSDTARYVSSDPAKEPNFWFVLDLAIGRECGRALNGPPPALLFAEIPREWQLGAIVESLQWHHEHQPRNPACVLNACRSWLYVETGRWASKPDAAAWVRAHKPEWQLAVDAALDALDRARELESSELAAEFTAHVHRTTREQLDL
jgi:hypothetical protein